MNYNWLSCLIFLVLSVGCYHLKERTSNANVPVKFLAVDTAVISSSPLATYASVHKFYELNNYSLAWSDTSGLTATGDSLFEFIKSTPSYGLNPADYHLPELEQLLSRPKTDQNIIRADILLSDGYFALSHHLKYGRVDSITFIRKTFLDIVDTAAILQVQKINALTIRETLEMRQPASVEYMLLKDSLNKLLTLQAPDSGALARIKQINVNMERRRWYGGLPDRCIYVNIPSFMLQVYDNKEVALESNVVVGTPQTPTPVLKSVIGSFIIYPYWQVPRSIAINEILPHVKKDSSYLAKRNYEVLDAKGNVISDTLINWALLHKNNFPYMLRQREGVDNTLGIIKFVFVNDYGVYLHDTNGRRSFTKKMRALSHGCVRVHKAIALAHYLVKDDSIYVTSDDLDQYLSLQQRHQIRVMKPIPLVIQYFTCESNNGVLQFYQDIYGKDQKILDALYPPIPEGTLTAVL